MALSGSVGTMSIEFHQLANVLTDTKEKKLIRSDLNKQHPLKTTSTGVETSGCSDTGPTTA